MLRTALEQPLLRTLSRGVSSSTALQQALPAVAAEPKSKGGFFSGLFGGGGDRVAVPLTDPLPGVQAPPHVGVPAAAPKTEMTTLANGFRIATENTPVRGGCGGSSDSCCRLPREGELGD